MSVMQSAAAAAVCILWHHISDRTLPFTVSLTTYCIASSQSRMLPLAWGWAVGYAAASRQFSTSVSSSRLPHLSTTYCLGMLLVTWLGTAASSPTLAQEGWAGWDRTFLVSQTRTNFHDSAAGTRVWNLELSANGPQTDGLVTQPFQKVAEDIFIWSVGPKCSVNAPLTAL